MKTTSDYTVNITVYSDRIVCVNEFIHPTNSSSKKAEVMKQNRSTKYNGFMSPSTRRQVRKIITSWVNALEHTGDYIDDTTYIIERRPTFVTLTLSDEQAHDDNFIKRKMLGRMITFLRRKHDVRYYFWRAEKQKNGRIHFHCIFDNFIDKKELQSSWNKIQKDFGYIDNFKKKYNYENPPSTHVEQITSQTNAIAYIMKYVTKNPDNMDDEKLKVHGRIWGCSDELRNLKPYTSAEDSDVLECLYSLAKNRLIDRFSDDFFEVFFIDSSEFFNTYFPSKVTDIARYYKKTTSMLYSNVQEKSQFSESEIEEFTDKIAEPMQLSLFKVSDAHIVRTAAPEKNMLH